MKKIVRSHRRRGLQILAVALGVGLSAAVVEFALQIVGHPVSRTSGGPKDDGGGILELSARRETHVTPGASRQKRFPTVLSRSSLA